MQRALTQHPWIVPAILILLTLVVYLPVLTTGGFIWDDDNYVTANKLLVEPGGLASIWAEPWKSPQYYPVVMSMFWGEYQLWGTHAFGYHLVNVVLHGLSAVLVWVILRRLRVPGALFGAALFVAHPVMVESVAWVTEGKNVLSTVFYLLAAWNYLAFERVGEDGVTGRWWGGYWAALGFFLLALMSKSVTATLPVALAIILWWKWRRVVLADLLPLAPMVVIGAGYGLFTAYLERNRVGAVGPEWDFSVVDRMLIAGRAICFYVSKLLIPVELVFVYPRWHVNAGAVWQWVFPVIVVAGGGWALAVRKKYPGVLAAVLFFIVTLFPALGFLNIFPMRYSFVADHFQYVAAIGILALLAAAAAWVTRFLKPGVRVGLGAVAIAVLSAMSMANETQYRDEATLWRRTIEKNPEAWIAYEDLGILEFNAQHYNAAVEDFERSLALKPENHVGVYANLGNGYLYLGRVRDAEKAYERGLGMAADSVTHAAIANGLGTLYAREGDLAKAAEMFRAAVGADPKLVSGWVNLAYAEMLMHQVEQARADVEKALALEPGNAKAKGLAAQLAGATTATQP